MEKLVIQAHLYKISKDREGEVKVTFCIPKTEAPAAMNIPEEKSLTLAIVVNP